MTENPATYAPNTEPGSARNPRHVELWRVLHPSETMRPRVLDEQAAAGYTGRAAATLRNLRYEDRKRIARGEKPLGPGWLMLGGKIVYPLQDWHDVMGLDRWMEESAVPYGEQERAA